MKKHAKIISSILALAAAITCMFSLMLATVHAEEATESTVQGSITVSKETINPVANGGQTFDMTALGSEDWIVPISGKNPPEYYRKNIETPLIQQKGYSGNFRGEGANYKMTWSDGNESMTTSTGYSAAVMKNYVAASDYFEYSVPVESYNQTLYMILGCRAITAKLEVYFESNPTDIKTITVNHVEEATVVGSIANAMAVIEFSGIPGDTLIARYSWDQSGNYVSSSKNWQLRILGLALNHEHTFEAVSAAEPTCTVDGVNAHYACACGALAADANGENVLTKDNVTIPASHTEAIDAAKDPTCTETGLTEGKHCSVCNEILVAQETVDALGHTEVVDAAVPATCKEAGKTEGKHCSVCNEVLVAQEVVPATGAHVYAEEKEKVPATCETAGYVIKACGCGETKRETLAALGHDYEAVVTAPTCTEAGYTTYTCKNDKAHTYVSDNVVALGHTNSEAVKENEKTPDCTTAGSYDSVVYCSVCKAEVSRETITVDALGHTNATAVVENNVAPDCDTAGSYDNVVYCSVCNAEVSRETKTVDALGHTETVDSAVAPTCTETGLTEGKHCSVCNEVIVAQTTVDALGHTEVIDAAVAPTCTKVGKTEGKHCSVCNEVLVAQTTISALGHTEVVDAAVAPTCTETGLTEGKHCSVCNNVFVAQVEVPATGHTEVVDAAIAPTCTEAGKTEGKHCSVCNEVLVAQEEIPAVGHDFEDATTKAPKTCKNCGATEGAKLNFFEGIWLAILAFFKNLFGIK